MTTHDKLRPNVRSPSRSYNLSMHGEGAPCSATDRIWGDDVRVLVTGGAGFLGSHLVDSLVDQNVEVTVVDNLSTGKAANVRPGVQLHRLSVCDPLGEVFSRVRPDLVVHLAAQVSVSASVTDPVYDLNVNTAATINVVQSAARAGVRKMIFISSAAVYGVPATVPINEHSTTVPVSPYGVSKLTAEHYIRLVGQRYGMAYTILRPANIYGPRQTSEGEGAVVPSFLQRFTVGADPIIHGTGEQTRDFVYVSDMVRAIVNAFTHGDGHTVNIGGGVATTIADLWHGLAAAIGWNRCPVYGPSRVGDIPHSVMNVAYARHCLDWQPRIPLRLGLAETVAWWRQMAEVATAKDL